MTRDEGKPDWAKPCPLCGELVTLCSTENTFSEKTYFLRCDNNNGCMFGDTKTVTWEKTLEARFNNRFVDFGHCVAKECYEAVVVRASHLCHFHEKEYL